MNDSLLSTRYARALLLYALERKVAPEVYGEMKTLADSFFQVPALRQALQNPVLSSMEKRNLMEEAAGGGVSIPTHRFFELVVSQRRESLLQRMAWQFIKLYQQHFHIFHLRLTTAVEATETICQRIVQLIRRVVPDAQVDLLDEVDPDILGGFILQLDHQVIDASVRSQLNDLQRKLIDSN